MTWAIAGKALTVWIIVAFAASPLIGRYFRSRRTNRHFQALVDNAKRPSRKEERELVNRELLISTMIEEQQNNEWQQRARRAEGLGFLDDDAPRPAA